MTEQANAPAADKSERFKNLERRFQSVALTLVSAGIMWSASTLITLVTQNAKIQTKLDTIDVQMGGMYRSSDAKRDIVDLQRQIDNNGHRNGEQDTRFDRIEHRVDALESASKPKRLYQ